MGRLTGAWPVIVPPSPGVLCALGDATTSPAGRVGPHLPAPVRRPRPATELTRDPAPTCPTAAVGAAGRAGCPAADQRDRLPGRRPVLRAGLRDPDRHRPGLAGRPGRRAGRPRRAVRRRARAAVLVPARQHRPRAGERPGLGQRPAAPEIAPTPLVPGDGDPAAAQTGTSKVYVDGGFADAALYDRAELRAGDVIDGPAIVIEMDSTTLILPGHAATADSVRQPADPPRRCKRGLSHGTHRRDQPRPAGPGRRRPGHPRPDRERAAQRPLRDGRGAVPHRAVARHPRAARRVPADRRPRREDGRRASSGCPSRTSSTGSTATSARATCCSPPTRTPAARRSATPTTGWS